MTGRLKVLVTGASGLIGRRVIADLGDRFAFSGLSRRPVECIPHAQADITDLHAVRSACRGMDMVLHLAAETIEYDDWDKVMDVTIQREIARLERRLLFLATVGSAGPFVGLFGTVWGIMTSFRAIAGQQTTSLAVVAPGIAEALFATAIGLVAAIPATIFYNKFVSDVNKQAQRLEGFADEFAAILSRQIDERG